MVACAVMTTSVVREPISRALLTTARPLGSGIRMSRKAMSTSPRSSAAIASVPLDASTTSCPSARRASPITQRIERSSSATRMRAPGLSDMVGSPLDRQRDREDGSAAGLALRAQHATVLRHDALRDGEAEPGASALGREERCEDAREVLGPDARALITHVDRQELLAAVRARDVVGRLHAGGHDDRPAAGRHLDRVPREVQEDLRQPAAIADDRRQARVVAPDEMDAVRCAGPFDREDAVDDLVDVDGGALEPRRAGQVEELGHEAVQPVDLADDDLRALAQAVLVAAPGGEELGGAAHARERVLDLVREAGEQDLELPEAIGLARPRLELALVAEVVQREQRSDLAAARVGEEGRGGPDRALPARAPDQEG